MRVAATFLAVKAIYRLSYGSLQCKQASIVNIGLWGEDMHHVQISRKVTAILLNALMIGGVIGSIFLMAQAGRAQGNSSTEKTTLLAKGDKDDKGNDRDDDDNDDANGRLRNRCQERKSQSIGGLNDNNKTIRLKEGVYRGQRTIEGNKITLIGVTNELRDRCATVIYGDLRITGNNVSLRNLVIRGDLVVQGNNANLNNLVITGGLRATGNNLNRNRVVVDDRFLRTP